MGSKSTEEVILMLPECRTLNVKEVATCLGIGLNSAYQLVHSKGFPALKIGKRIVVPIEKLEQWISVNTPNI